MRLPKAPSDRNWFVRLVYWYSRRELGRVVAPAGAMAHSPFVLAGATGLELALDRTGTVDDRLKLLAELKAASMIGCVWCLDKTSLDGRRAGLTEEELCALADYGSSDLFSPREQVVIAYAEALTEIPVSVSDELFASLRDHLDDQQIVELTATIAWENFGGRFNRGLGIGAEGFAGEAGCPVPAELMAAAAATTS